MMSNTSSAPLASTTSSTGPSMALPVTGLVSNNTLTSTGLPLPGAHHSGMTGLMQPVHQQGGMHTAGQPAGFVAAGIPHLAGTDASLPPVESHVTLPAPILAPGQAPALLHGGSGTVHTGGAMLHDQHHTGSHGAHHTGMHGATTTTTGMHGSTGMHQQHTTGMPLSTTTTTSTTTSNMPLVGVVPAGGHLEHQQHGTHGMMHSSGSHGAHHSGSHGAHSTTAAGAHHPTMMEKIKSHLPGHHASAGAHTTDSHHSTTSGSHGSHGAHGSTSHGSTTSTGAHPSMMEKIKSHLPGHHASAGAHTTDTHHSTMSGDHHTTDKHLLAEREKESHRLAKEQEKLAHERAHEHPHRTYATGVTTGAMPLATGTTTTTGMPLTTGAPLMAVPVVATGAMPLAHQQHHTGGEMHHTAPGMIHQSGALHSGAGMHTGALGHGHTTGHLTTPDAILPAGAVAPGAISHTHHIHATAAPTTTTAMPMVIGGAPHLLGGEQKKEYRQDLMAQQPMTTGMPLATTTTGLEHHKLGEHHGTAQPMATGHGVTPFPGSHPTADKMMMPGTGAAYGSGSGAMLTDGQRAAMDLAGAGKMSSGMAAVGQPGYLGNTTMPGAGNLQPIGTTTATGAPHPVIAGASQVGNLNLADPPRHVF